MAGNLRAKERDGGRVCFLVFLVCEGGGVGGVGKGEEAKKGP